MPQWERSEIPTPQWERNGPPAPLQERNDPSGPPRERKQQKVRLGFGAYKVRVVTLTLSQSTFKPILKFIVFFYILAKENELNFSCCDLF